MADAVAADHTGITVADLDAAVAFFVEVLGFVEERRAHLDGAFAADVVGVAGAEIGTAVLAGAGTRVELLEYHAPAHSAAVNDGPEVPGSMHLAFRVDDLDTVLAAAAAPGGRPRGVRPPWPRALAPAPGSSTCATAAAPPWSSSPRRATDQRRAEGRNDHTATATAPTVRIIAPGTWM